MHTAARDVGVHTESLQTKPSKHAWPDKNNRMQKQDEANKQEQPHQNDSEIYPWIC